MTNSLFYYVPLFLLSILLINEAYKKIMILIGRNSILTEEVLLNIASEFIAHKKVDLIKQFRIFDDAKFSILIELVRIEISLNQIRTIRQLDDYLTGKFEQEIKIVFEANA